MKKTITKIWSIGLTLALVASMLVFAVPVPVAAAPGNMQWESQPLPSGTSLVIVAPSDVADIAVANDGVTIYVISDEEGSTGSVFRSGDAGQSFVRLDSYNLISGLSGMPVAVAVAPDNPQIVAVATAAMLYLSTNSGTTWTPLSGLPTASASATITDCAVGPARSGTLLGRDYAVSVADPNTNSTNTTNTNGDVLILGKYSYWVSAGATTGITGSMDFMAVAFTPNFVGDRVVVAVGASTATGTGNITAGVYVHLLNSDTGLQVIAPTALHTARVTDFQTSGTDLGDIVAADIALPTDFDPATSSGRRTYAGIATAATFTDCDVYRVDDSESRDLGAVSNQPIQSVAYSGTIDEGTLFMGQKNTNTIKFSTNPQVSLPTWTTTKKKPDLSTNTDTVVRVSPDFAATSKVFAGTTGSESAFNASINAGVSFDAESLVDNGDDTNDTVVAVQSIAVSADGKWLYAATDTGSNVSLWKSSTPVSATSWTRIYVIESGTQGLVKLNPAWADAPVVYFTNQTTDGKIYRSTDGGDIFSERASPTGTNITAMAIQDANTVYVSVSTAVYKSTTGAWTWNDAKDGKASTIVSLAVPKADHLLVGGTNAVSYSTDGGSVFTKIDAGLPTTATFQVLADAKYATNNTIFAGGSNAATGNIYRYLIGASSSWESLGNRTFTSPAAPSASGIVALGMANAALYGMSAATTDRHLAPTAATSTVAGTWDTMDTTGVAGITNFAVGGNANVLYAANSTTSLWAYDDFFALAKPKVTSPASGATIGIDPVSGRADPFIIAIDPVGTGLGGGNRIDIAFREVGEAWRLVPDINNVSVAPAGPTTAINAEIMTLNSYFLKANTKYEFRLRFDNQATNDYVRTPWSDAVALSIAGGTVVQQPYAGPIILGPQGGSTTSLLPGISWAPYSGATKYQIILATDSALTKRVAGTPVIVTSPAWQPTAPLEYGTTYFFAITAVEPTVSPQSVGTFATMAKPVVAPAPAPPVVVKEVPAPIINIPAAPAPQVIAPAFIWAIVIIGAVLVIAVIVLIVRTRRPM